MFQSEPRLNGLGSKLCNVLFEKTRASELYRNVHGAS